MDISRKEILRYLGYGKQESEEPVMELVEECVSELFKAEAFKYGYREYPLTVSGQTINAGCFQTESKSLARNLLDCNAVIVFAATLGIGVDILIQKNSRLQMSKAVVLQAVAAAMIEAGCDEVNQALKEEYEQKSLYLRPRFSPGYGDFPLECQKSLLMALEAGKRIGITLTDSLLMAPSKSVTAVIGVSEIPRFCSIKGCELCDKADCIYRR